ncbi:hypothetical protein ACRAWD_29605 [Caulobacter segnis]
MTDYPMVAMTAARTWASRTRAVDWLFFEARNNKFGVSGMTPRVHLDEHAQAFVPKAGEGDKAEPDGPGYTRAAETYFPSNGSLLAAVAMMAGGWDRFEGPDAGLPEGRLSGRCGPRACRCRNESPGASLLRGFLTVYFTSPFT